MVWILLCQSRGRGSGRREETTSDKKVKRKVLHRQLCESTILNTLKQDSPAMFSRIRASFRGKKKDKNGTEEATAPEGGSTSTATSASSKKMGKQPIGKSTKSGK